MPLISQTARPSAPTQTGSPNHEVDFKSVDTFILPLAPRAVCPERVLPLMRVVRQRPFFWRQFCEKSKMTFCAKGRNSLQLSKGRSL